VIRILIADDHEIVRRGIEKIIADAPDMRVTAVASDGAAALERALEATCDVALLDITMPGMSGIDVLKQLRRQKPDLPVLILTIHPEERYAVRALRAGAAGYLSKDTVADELIGAIRKIAEGRRYVSESLGERLASILEGDSDKPIQELLSDREYQVMLLLARGRAVKEIAAELALSHKTVSTYRARVLDKMQLSSNADLTAFALRNNLIE